MNAKPSRKKPARRDPRFDDACGEFNAQTFDNDYKFLKKMRNKEKHTLKKQLKTSELDDEDFARKSLELQRLKSQRAEEAKKHNHQKMKDQKLLYEIEQLKQGRKPYYCKPADEQLLLLIRKYEQLKDTGRLSKYMSKKQKKSMRKVRDMKAG